MSTWFVYGENAKHHVVLVDGEGIVERVHPIPFEDRREAVRAATRLNLRDGSE
jgi:hypothetical protein